MDKQALHSPHLSGPSPKQPHVLDNSIPNDSAFNNTADLGNKQYGDKIETLLSLASVIHDTN